MILTFNLIEPRIMRTVDWDQHGLGKFGLDGFTLARSRKYTRKFVRI